MKGFIGNIEKLTRENENYRRVLYTGHTSQLVLMSLRPGEEIGEEVHDLDQFIRIELGVGRVTINNVEHDVTDDDGVVIPQGAKHNVINTGEESLKLYSIYSPPEHRDGTVHRTKADADSAHEHFDGKTTE